jgi:hypothetical protein
VFKKLGETEGLHDFLNRLQDYSKVNVVEEEAKLSTMSKYIPENTLKKAIVRCVHSNLTYQGNYKRI